MFLKYFLKLTGDEVVQDDTTIQQIDKLFWYSAFHALAPFTANEERLEPEPENNIVYFFFYLCIIR